MFDVYLAGNVSYLCKPAVQNICTNISAISPGKDPYYIRTTEAQIRLHVQFNQNLCCLLYILKYLVIFLGITDGSSDCSVSLKCILFASISCMQNFRFTLFLTVGQARHCSESEMQHHCVLSLFPHHFFVCFGRTVLHDCGLFLGNFI